ncbi:unnamed protein product [Closterium sp. Naga37s-1]|nr:unnamed protein product [Closterium sp. Naga37s-1]
MVIILSVAVALTARHRSVRFSAPMASVLRARVLSGALRLRAAAPKAAVKGAKKGKGDAAASAGWKGLRDAVSSRAAIRPSHAAPFSVLPLSPPADAARASSVPVEVRAATVVGGNILKTGSDPPVLPDSEYPEWLWTLLDRQAPLSELKRKRIEDMGMAEEQLERLVKLDNRDRIRATNASRAKA